MAGIGTLDPALVGPVAELQARSDARAEAAWTSEDLTTDLRPDLPAIDVPFTKIMPYAPPAAPAYTVEQTRDFYASLLPGAKTAQVLPVESARHDAMLDAPDAFYDVLDGFLWALPS